MRCFLVNYRSNRHLLIISLLLATVTLRAQTNNYVYAGRDNQICADNTITLSDSDTSGCISITWTTSGDGNFNNIHLLHPIYTPGANDIVNGTVDLTLAGELLMGGQQSDELLLTIHPMPVSSFTFSPDNACKGSNIQFNSSSSVNAQTYNWDFGDGETSTEANPSHVFQGISYGGGSENKLCILTVENQYGCSNSSNQTVHIKQGPEASLTDPNTNFNNCSTGGGLFSIMVLNTSSTSSINSSYTIDWGDGSPVFSGSAFSTQSHTYNTGIYTITHTVSGANGCSDTKTYNVLNITNPGLGITNQGNTMGCSPKDITFLINDTDVNHNSTYYVVDYGDGSPEETFNHPPPAQVTHTYTETSCGQPDNQYVFSVTAINACSQTTATVDAIRIYTAPESHFSIDQSLACTGDFFNFTNQSIPGYNNSCQQTTLYTWYFGDGQSQSLNAATAVSHSYTNKGVYQVELHAGNTCAIDIETHSLCVDSIPVVSFDVNTNSLCPGENLTISNTSANMDICSTYQYDWTVAYEGGGCGGSSGSWNYANGTTSNSFEPVFVFNSAGNYTLSLTASNACGSSTINKNIFIKDEPVCQISSVDDSYCGEASINPEAIINDCGGTMSYFNWQFPGGTPSSSISQEPGTIVYDQAGTHTISLSVGNECGIGTTSFTFIVKELPVASAMPAEQSICSGSSTNIVLTSSLAGQTSFSFFPENETGITNTSAGTGNLIDQEPFNSDDLVRDVLYKIIPEANGCKGDTAEALVHVNPVPVLNNTDLVDSVCSGAEYSITFTGNLPAVSFEWSVSNASSNVSGFAQSGNGTLLEENYDNSSSSVGYVIYDILPVIDGCYGVSKQLTVYVKPIPAVSINNTTPSLCSGSSCSIEIYSAPEGAEFHVETEAIAGISGNTNYTGTNGLIEQTLTNNLTIPKTITYSIYAVKDGCTSSVQTTEVIVNPLPEANISTSSTASPQTICSGDQTEEVLFESNVIGTTFNWQVSNTTSTPVYELSSGNSSGIPVQTMSVSGNSDGEVEYTIVPSASSCQGESIIYTYQIQALPVVTNNPAKQKLCSGMNFPAVNLTANMSNIVIHWQVISGSSLGVSHLSGTGTLPEETLTNPAHEPDTVIYRIYAVRTDGLNCNGPDFYYYRIIKSLPDVLATPTSQQICPGTSTSIQLSSTTHPGQATFSWEVAANDLGSFSSSGATIISQVLHNNTNTNQSVIYEITASYDGCQGASIQVPVQVYPMVYLTNDPKEKDICSGEETQIQLYSNLGSGTTNWTWTGNAPNGGINGISSAGNTPLINDQLTNLTFETKVAEYTINPSANGCAGISSVYQVFVDPAPDIQANPSNSVICSGESTYIQLTSSVNGATKKWRVEFPASSIQGATAGTGSIIEQSLINTSLQPQTVTYYSWAEYNNCSSEEVAAQVVVNPVPTASANPLNQTLCSGQNMDTVHLSADVSGTIFSWNCTTTSPDVTGYQNGSGNMIYGDALSNTSNINQSVFYHITPQYAGCSGIEIMHTALVRPGSYVTNPSADLYQAICSGDQSQLFIPESNVNGAIFNWDVYYAGSNLSGFQMSGTGSIPPQTIINTGLVADTLVYEITPQANGCLGEAAYFRILVKPVPVAISTPASDQICSGDNVQFNLSCNLGSGCQFSWTTANTSGISNVSNGTGNQIIQTPQNSTNDVKTFSYRVTAEKQGCTGNQLSIPVTVKPLPRIINTDLDKTICSGSTTDILIQSSRENTTYNWSGNQLSGNFIDGISNSGTTNPINDLLTNNEEYTGTVVYTVVPTASGCAGESKDFQVEVVPSPSISIDQGTTNICNQSYTEIDVTADFGDPTIYWEATSNSSVSGHSNGNAVGGTQIHQQLQNTANSEQQVHYAIYSKSGNCYSDTTIVTIIVQPEPDAWYDIASPQYICNDGLTQLVEFESDVDGLSYEWQGSPSVPGILSGYYSTIQNTSYIPQHHIQNTGSQTAWVSYQITPSLGNCQGDEFTYKIYVYPVTHITNADMAQDICNGESTEEVVFETDVPAEVQWEAVNPPSGLNNYVLSGTGNLPSMAVSNTSLQPKTLVYEVIPFSGSGSNCPGVGQNYSITIYPTVSGEASPNSQDICSGDSAIIHLSSNIAGADFSWTVSHSSFIVNVSGGSGATIRHKPINTGDNIELINYTVSPEKSGCIGEVFSASVYVMPVPHVLNATSDSICYGETTNIQLVSNVEGANFAWTASPSSGSVSGYTPNLQQGTLIQDLLINSSTQMQWVTYTVSATANNCSGPNYEITVYVNPSPEVDFVPEQTILCSGESTDIHLSSSTNNVNFEWTVSVPPGFSGASSGNGNYINHTIVNGNNTSGTIIYHVNANKNGCPGAPEDYSVLVKPRPGVNINELGQSICSGAFTTAVEISSNVANTEFHWSGTASSDELSGYFQNMMSGDQIPSHQIINPTTNQEYVNYKIHAISNGCTGDSIIHHINIIPRPELQLDSSQQELCSGSTSTQVLLYSTIQGTSYSWTAIDPNGFCSGYLPQGNGNIPPMNISNSGNETDTVIYRIVPRVTMGMSCPGDTSFYLMIVHPAPQISASPASQVLCSGDTTNISLQSTVNGTEYYWTVVAPDSVEGAANGSGFSIVQNLHNLTNVPQTVHYHVYGNAQGCQSSIIDVLVQVNPAVYLDSPPFQKSICSGASTNVLLSANVDNASFCWSASCNSSEVSGFADDCGNQIDQILINHDVVNHTVS